MRSQETRGGGCLGCVTVLALLIACVIGLAHVVGPTPTGKTIQAYTERTLEEIGVTEPRTHDANVYGHAWYQLDEAGQRAYQVLLEGVTNHDESIVVIDATPADVEAAYSAMMNDHPELFWLDGSFSYITPDLFDSVTVQPGLEVDLSEIPALTASIEAEADAILGAVGEGASQYDIVRHVYEHIASHTDYVVDSPHNQTIQSVFLNHESVCAGYARAFQYLLHRAGIECAYVEGIIDSSGEDHAWNLVNIDGQYAYVDPTWADPTYAGENAEAAADDVIYDYLCLTTDEIRKDDHTFSNLEEWPPCNSIDLDYFRREGLFFDTYDEGALGEAFWRQAESDKNQAMFKFGNDEAYAQALEALSVGNFQRANLLALASNRGADTIRYSFSTSDGLRIIKLYW